MSDSLLDEAMHRMNPYMEDNLGHIWGPQYIISNLTSGTFSYKRQCQKCEVLSDDKYAMKMCLWVFR